jgi:hypothetical protein
MRVGPNGPGNECPDGNPELGGGEENLMVKIHRNFVVSYLLLVILPVLALLGILKYGRTLTAPLAVSGVWKIQTDGALAENFPCGAFLGSIIDAPVVVSQSGKNLILTLRSGVRETAMGVIEGGTLTASFLPIDSGASNSDCGGNGPFFLTATVDPASTPRTFSGTFTILGCTSCGAAPVHAVREEQASEQSRP